MMKFQTIQAGRAIAAMAVVLFHLGGAFGAAKYFNAPIFAQAFTFGSSGVEFFFVLSGFIISYVHAKDVGYPASLPRYVMRRIVRIYPTYWIIFISVVAFATLVPAFHHAVPRETWTLVKSLLLLPQNPAVVGGTGAPVLIVAWSMQYEIVFYVAFALLIISPFVGGVALLAIFLWWLLSASSFSAAVFPLGFMQPHYFLIFAVGMLASKLTRRGAVRSPLSWLAAGLALYFCLAWYQVFNPLIPPTYRPAGTLVSFSYGLACGMIVCGLLGMEMRQKPFIPDLLLQIGDSSYALYLIHFPIISGLCKVLSKLGSGIGWTIASFVFIFCVCCAASIAFHAWIERPLGDKIRLWLQLRARPLRTG